MALGQNRAVFPDDMPTLSALPWEEREKILSSMGNDGEAEDPAPVLCPSPLPMTLCESSSLISSEIFRSMLRFF